MDALDLDIFEVGPVRRLESEAVREIVEFQSHRIVGVCLEFNAADLDHCELPPDRGVVARLLTVPHSGTTVSYIGRKHKSPIDMRMLRRKMRRGLAVVRAIKISSEVPGSDLLFQRGF